MARYTDTDALEKEMLFWSDTYGYGGLTKDNIREIIKSSPTADVRENVHAHWEYGHYVKPERTFHWYRECSNCGYQLADDDIDEDVNFCPNCGAEMCERREDD